MSEIVASAFSRYITFMALGDDPELLDEEFVRLLTELTTERAFNAGEVLQKQGEVVTELLLITEGAVHQADGRAPPDGPVMHGMEDILLERTFNRSLVAKSAGRALAVKKDALLELLEDQLPTATTMLAMMAVRLLCILGPRSREGRSIDVGSSLVDHALAFRGCETFANISAETISCLARLSRPKELHLGDSLPLSPATLHMLVRGEIVVSRKGFEIDAQRYLGLTLVNAAGTFAGARGFDARALQGSTFLVLDKEDLITEMQHHFGLWLALAGAVIRERRFPETPDSSTSASLATGHSRGGQGLNV